MPFREGREGVLPRDVVSIVANSLLLETAFLLHMEQELYDLLGKALKENRELKNKVEEMNGELNEIYGV